MAERVMRYSIGPLRFVRRPVSILPPDGTVCFVDAGTELRPGYYHAALYRDGAWMDGRGSPMKIVPTHWTDHDGA